MSIRDIYDYVLIELNKVEAASILLEDFNYFVNKAVQQYINTVYNRYDINQQSSDDLRVLKATSELDLTKNSSGSYETILPDDYMHILNCIVRYRLKKNYKCYKAGEIVDFPARRLTADMTPGIMHNVYMKPEYKRPYYYINNVNLSGYDGKLLVPTNSSTYPNNSNDLKDSAKPDDTRLSNASKVRIEIKTGNDSIFEPVKIYVDYIKSPMFIRLEYDDITSTEDHTRALEFPDYVCFEIINELVKLLMENSSDSRVQTNYAVNQTIANPLQSGG